MRIGLALPHYDFSIPGVHPIGFDDVADVAVRAERLGFDSVWMSDHFFASLGRYGGGHERYGSLEPLSTLAALAALTDRVRLGTLVLSAGFRHPAIVAKSATAIDRLSGGRMELGLGAGWFAEEYEAFGFGFADVDERFGRLEETMGYLDALFGTSRRRSEASASSCARRTTTRGPCGSRVRRCSSVATDPRMLKLAVRLADGWNTVWRWTPEAYAERAAAARETCERQGRDPASFRLSLGLFTIVGEDDADVVRRYELMRERLPAGVVDAVPLDELRQDGLVGTPTEVLERLERFAALGVSELVVSPAPLWFALPDPSVLDLLAERVLPAARAL